MKNRSNLFEVYRTAHGCIYQCDRTSRFLVEFAGYITPFNVICFLGLKSKVDRIDLDSLFLSSEADIEIINPCGSERVYALSLTQLVEFKELLAGAKVMLELNSIIRERLDSVLA